MSHAFHIVDVFAQEPYAGNPLAVVLDADDLAPETMLRIAGEMNYSESTFVHSGPEPDGGHRVRMFTPAREIAFAGHPILGTAWVIRRLAPGAPDEVRLHLPVGKVPVTFERDARGRELAWLLAPPVALGPACAPGPMAAALHLAPEDLEPRLPVQVAGAGISAIIVPLRHRDALGRARLDLEAFADLAGQGFPPLVYLFCPEPRDPENHLCARFFFEAHGVREDPAAGNATAFLGAYLMEHGYFPQAELDLRIEQGFELGRPSLLLLRVRRDGAGLRIRVGGAVVATAEGRLLT
jgi:trans-2,3-dihydro-3-hydroxyanthranilate isomerase